MATAIFIPPKRQDRLAQLWQDLLTDPVPPLPIPVQRMAPVLRSRDEPLSRRWKRGLETLFHSLMELENAETPAPSADQASAERETVSEMSIEEAHEESLSISSPFRWEPKPAWVNAPVPSTAPLSSLVDPRRFAAMPKIPLRPLHKQPFYSRFFFYLRHWRSRNISKTG